MPPPLITESCPAQLRSMELLRVHLKQKLVMDVRLAGIHMPQTTEFAKKLCDLS